VKVIADPETGGLLTECLIMNWRLSRTCQIHGCDERARAILSFESPEPLTVTICEKHYKEGKAKGKIDWPFDLGLKEEMKRCPECNGTGEIEIQIGGDGYDNRCCAVADVPVECPECNGTGKA